MTEPGPQGRPVLTGHRAEWRAAGELGAGVALGAELELEFYPGGGGEPLRDSQRENGMIVSRPGKKICLTQSPFPHHLPGTCSVGSMRKN